MTVLAVAYLSCCPATIASARFDPSARKTQGTARSHAALNSGQCLAGCMMQSQMWHTHRFLLFELMHSVLSPTGGLYPEESFFAPKQSHLSYLASFSIWEVDCWNDMQVFIPTTTEKSHPDNAVTRTPKPWSNLSFLGYNVLQDCFSNRLLFLTGAVHITLLLVPYVKNIS
jgi:hypothetical protein